MESVNDSINEALSDKLISTQSKYDILVLKRMCNHLKNNDNILDQSIKEVSEEFPSFSEENKSDARKNILKTFEEYAKIGITNSNGKVDINLDDLTGTILIKSMYSY